MQVNGYTRDTPLVNDRSAICGFANSGKADAVNEGHSESPGGGNETRHHGDQYPVIAAVFRLSVFWASQAAGNPDSSGFRAHQRRVQNTVYREIL